MPLEESGCTVDISQQGVEKRFHSREGFVRYIEAMDMVPREIRVFPKRKSSLSYGRLHIVTEEDVGRSLAEFSAYSGIDPRCWVWSLLQLIGSLRNMHRRGVLHRRICPEHVCVTRDEGLRLLYNRSMCRTSMLTSFPMQPLSLPPGMSLTKDPTMNGLTPLEWMKVDAYGMFLVMCKCFAGFLACQRNCNPKHAGVLNVLDYYRTQLQVSEQELQAYWDLHASVMLPGNFFHAIGKRIKGDV